MREFDVYSPVDVISANLAEIRERQLLLGEQELAHLHELAVEICSVARLPELLAALPDHRLGRMEPHAPSLLSPSSLERTRRTVLLCREIARIAQEKKELPLGFFFPESERLPVSAPQRIIYQRNSYTNEAILAVFRKSSRRTRDLRAQLPCRLRGCLQRHFRILYSPH